MCGQLRLDKSHHEWLRRNYSTRGLDDYRLKNTFMFDYSSIKELISKIEKNPNLRVVDGWQENRFYCLEIQNATGSIRIKVLIP